MSYFTIDIKTRRTTLGPAAPGLDKGAVEIPLLTMADGSSIAYHDPVIPPAQRDEKIDGFVLEREGIKKKIQAFEKQIKNLDPKDPKAVVEISKLKQEETKNMNQIHMLNFSITEELRKAPEPKK